MNELKGQPRGTVPRWEPKQCNCPDERMLLRAYVGTALDQIRQGFLTLECSCCGERYKYVVGDCLTLKHRRKISIH